MAERFVWDAARDRRLRALRWEGTTWEEIAQAMDIGRYTVLERGRRLGARRRQPPRVEVEAADRPCRPAGHPVTWGLLVTGTVLEGSAYPYPVFL